MKDLLFTFRNQVMEVSECFPPVFNTRLEMSRDEVLAQLKKDVRSLLISSKLGLEPQQLSQDYFQMLGHPMPLKMLGYRNVMHFVSDAPDVVSVCVASDQRVCLKAVCDATTRNQAALVTKQRLSKADRKFQRQSYCSFPPPPPPFVAFHGRFHSSTFVPPDLRMQLHHLLSRGPVRLGELELRYFQCFGFPLFINNFGFRTKEEMLAAASDLVALRCDPLGSVLVLKQHLFPEPLFRPPPTTRRAGPLRPAWLPAMKVPPPVNDALNRCCSHNAADLQENSAARLAVGGVTVGGVTGAVGTELKEKLRQVVGRRSDGLSVNDLTVEFKKLLGEDLPLEQFGFVNVIDLIESMSDVFRLQPAGGDYRIQHVVPDKHVDVKTDLKVLESFNDGVRLVPDRPADPDETEKAAAACGAPPDHLVTTVPMDAVLSRRLKPPTRHRARELIEVSVEEVLSPGHFYVRFIFSEETNTFEEMMIDMRRCYRCSEVSAPYGLPEQFVRPGQVCCLSPAGWWFYRAVIHRVLSSTEVEVYYVDFGTMATVQTAKLKFLKSCYSVLPAQGVPSSLAGIAPTNGRWTAEALESFRELSVDHVLVGLLDHYVGDVLQLYLCDTSTSEDVYSHEVLISRGHGKACSPALSAALSPRVTPVSFYLGEGLQQLPEVEVKRILTPQPWESQEEEVDMPSLEPIE